MKVLFIDSSAAYMHDMPKTAKKMRHAARTVSGVCS